MKNSQIELVGIRKVYHANGLPVCALDGIGLGVTEGEFTVLAGPSGSGKSTILHLIGGLDRPTEGRVLVDGDDLYARDREALADFRLHRIGFVFQAYNLIPVLTARENVEYPLLLQRVDRAEREQRSLELLHRVGLSDQSGKKPGEMSGGQQQRVAVARALAARPRLILADEPTANLDSATGSALIDLFRELNEQYKVTFLFASHDPMVIRRAHRVIHLKDGRVEKEERL
jgi:putative ABC transport system ATP-binding protein